MSTSVVTESPLIGKWTTRRHPVLSLTACLWLLGGGLRVVVSTAALHASVRGSVPGLGGLKEAKMFLPHPRVKVSIVGSLRDREVACSASDRQGSNFESCVWRTVSSQSSHHPQEVLLAQFSLYVHKGGLKPDSFHLILSLVVTLTSYIPSTGPEPDKACVVTARTLYSSCSNQARFIRLWADLFKRLPYFQHRCSGVCL